MFVLYQTLRAVLICLLFFSMPQTRPEKEVWMTVFVHGIMSIQSHLSIGLICKLLCDNISGSMYADTVTQMRKDNFFQHNQLMQQLGLHQITHLGNNAQTAPEVLATLYDIATQSTHTATQNIYYTFGWSGLLSACARKSAAHAFHLALYDEVTRLKESGLQPRIRLIGYSHGANVCLQLAESKYQFLNKQLSIDEFILIGCPIHSDSNRLVNDPIFKSVYNFYSRRDQIQLLDCFSSPDFFSRRRFFNKKNVTISSKVTQASIRVTHAIRCQSRQYHACFSFSKKLQRLRSCHYLKDESAGHIELWFLGWTPRHYRKQFVLYPYPILVFIPCIIDALKNSGLSHNGTTYKLTVDLRPDFEEIIVTRYDEKKKYKQPFPYKTLSSLFKPIAKSAEPKYYTKQSSSMYIAVNKKQAVAQRTSEGIVSTKNKRLRNFFRFIDKNN